MSSLTPYLDKLKKLPQDKLAQLTVVVLICYIASILANLSYLVIPSNQAGAPIASAARQAGGGQNQSGDSVNISALTSMNIFGAYVRPQDAPKAVEVIQPDEEIPETSLNLTLTATVAINNNSGEGNAIIQSGGTQSTYGLDDKIDGTTATLKLVYHDRVIIQNGMRRETLMLDGVEYDRMNVPHPVESDDREEQLSLDEDEGHQIDMRDDPRLTQRLEQTKQDINDNPTKLYDLVRFSPFRRDGELVGYRLNPGKEPDLFKRAGFHANDLAVEVNGKPLNDIKAAMEVLREFREMTEANIVVERDGVRTEILFSLDSGGDDAKEARDEPPQTRQHGLIEQR